MLGISDKRNEKSLKKSLTFAFLNADLEVQNPTDLGVYYAMFEAAESEEDALMDKDDSDDDW